MRGPSKQMLRQTDRTTKLYQTARSQVLGLGTGWCGRIRCAPWVVTAGCSGHATGTASADACNTITQGDIDRTVGEQPGDRNTDSLLCSAGTFRVRTAAVLGGRVIPPGALHCKASHKKDVSMH